MKKCSMCGELKDFDKFYKSNKGGDGRDNYCKDCRSITAKRYRQQKHVKERHRDKNLLDKYGISKLDYEVMFDKQQGRCAICGGDNVQGHLYSKRKVDYFSVDHCHKTGKVRGLLCLSCNIALGNFKDDIDFLKKAIKYLEISK